MGGTAKDKLLVSLLGRAAIARSLEAFVASGVLDRAVVVYRDAAQRAALEAALGSPPLPLEWTQGGAERHLSVWRGLAALPPSTERALIHDGARPLVAPETIRKVLRALPAGGAACAARRVTDTIKEAPDAASARFAPRTLDRSRLWAAETPQAFEYALVRDAYERLVRSGRPVTDDLAAVEEEGVPVAFVESESPNPKLTTPQDIEYALFLLERARGAFPR